jgi:hypothetical protein
MYAPHVLPHHADVSSPKYEEESEQIEDVSYAHTSEVPEQHADAKTVW